MKSVFGKQERRWLYSKRYIRLKKAEEREANKKQADSHHRLWKRLRIWMYVVFLKAATHGRVEIEGSSHDFYHLDALDPLLHSIYPHN